MITGKTVYFLNNSKNWYYNIGDILSEKLDKIKSVKNYFNNFNTVCTTYHGEYVIDDITLKNAYIIKRTDIKKYLYNVEKSVKNKYIVTSIIQSNNKDIIITCLKIKYNPVEYISSWCS